MNVVLNIHPNFILLIWADVLWLIVFFRFRKEEFLKMFCNRFSKDMLMRYKKKKGLELSIKEKKTMVETLKVNFKFKFIYCTRFPFLNFFFLFQRMQLSILKTIVKSKFGALIFDKSFFPHVTARLCIFSKLSLLCENGH